MDRLHDAAIQQPVLSAAAGYRPFVHYVAARKPHRCVSTVHRAQYLLATGLLVVPLATDQGGQEIFAGPDIPSHFYPLEVHGRDELPECARSLSRSWNLRA